MTNVMQFPRGRPVPPPRPAIEDELLKVELRIAELRLAQFKAEMRHMRALWTWWAIKRLVWLAVLLWLLTTVFARAAEAGQFRQFFNSNGGYEGSSSRPGNGRFTNFYDRNGRYVGTELRRGRR